MKELEITLDMIGKARTKSTEMGVLKNSIIRGNGNIAGFVGEQIALCCLGGEWQNTYEYDILMPNGQRVDVKTKQTSVTPLPDYDCSIAKFNTKQKCDSYAFVRVKKDLTVGWYLGKIDKDDFFNKARFMKKGTVDPSNNYKVQADCYNIKIKELGT
jgi:hypothetical protein|tara:strand:+ start:388 stop:858 length:471 start_codon:yes stop_codon:yes gene_type:complete